MDTVSNGVNSSWIKPKPLTHGQTTNPERVYVFMDQFGTAKKPNLHGYLVMGSFLKGLEAEKKPNEQLCYDNMTLVQYELDENQDGTVSHEESIKAFNTVATMKNVAGINVSFGPSIGYSGGCEATIAEIKADMPPYLPKGHAKEYEASLSAFQAMVDKHPDNVFLAANNAGNVDYWSLATGETTVSSPRMVNHQNCQYVNAFGDNALTYTPQRKGLKLEGVTETQSRNGLTWTIPGMKHLFRKQHLPEGGTLPGLKRNTPITEYGNSYASPWYMGQVNREHHLTPYGDIPPQSARQRRAKAQPGLPQPKVTTFQDYQNKH